MLKLQRQGRGWLPDPPDSRDYIMGGDVPGDVAAMIVWLRQFSRPNAKRPECVDLRRLFEDEQWPVHDQQEFNTSPVFASVGLVEYFERIAHDRELTPSYAYLYCMSRRIADSRGDCGVSLRNCFRALRRFGLPPDRYWPYDNEHVTCDPVDPFLYSFARDYAQTYYVRVGPQKLSGKKTLRAVRSMLAAGFAVACGFATPNRLPDEGAVPYRPDVHEITTGQAVVLIGYDDTRRIGSETGALLFRNSWGPEWGEDGYGWLPYVYVTERLAGDFWTLLRREWIETGLATRRFSCPAFL
ncbi:MAG: C1 family peptidase [Planctomycetaceae bacterium]